MLHILMLALGLGCAHAHSRHHNDVIHAAPPPPRRSSVVHQHRHRGVVWVWAPGHYDKHGRYIKGHWKPKYK